MPKTKIYGLDGDHLLKLMLAMLNVELHEGLLPQEGMEHDLIGDDGLLGEIGDGGEGFRAAPQLPTVEFLVFKPTQKEMDYKCDPPREGAEKMVAKYLSAVNDARGRYLPHLFPVTINEVREKQHLLCL